jgi:hypothetical protein
MTFASLAASYRRCSSTPYEPKVTVMTYIRAPTTSTSASPSHCSTTSGMPRSAADFAARHTPGRGTAIAERLRLHAQLHAEIVARALGLLNRDFDTPDNIGPYRAAAFTVATDDELEDAAADAHGFVDDLLRATARLGLRPLDF